MAREDSTWVGKVRQFSALKDWERFVIVQHNEGVSWDEISVELTKSYPKVKKSVSTIRQYFSPGGSLEQANTEYLEQLAIVSLREAKQLARRASRAAISTMTALMAQSYDPTVRLGAAKALANKYIPDKQVMLTDTAESDLPEELTDQADEIVAPKPEPEKPAEKPEETKPAEAEGKVEDGPKQVDDPQQGQGDNSQPGPAGG